MKKRRSRWRKLVAKLLMLLVGYYGLTVFSLAELEFRALGVKMHVIPQKSIRSSIMF